MPRLPIPGQDGGIWGNLLNEYLSVSHNTDGTIKPSALSGAVVGATGPSGATGPTGPQGATGPAGGDGILPSDIFWGSESWQDIYQLAVSRNTPVNVYMVSDKTIPAGTWSGLSSIGFGHLNGLDWFLPGGAKLTIANGATFPNAVFFRALNGLLVESHSNAPIISTGTFLNGLICDGGGGIASLYAPFMRLVGSGPQFGVITLAFAGRAVNGTQPAWSPASYGGHELLESTDPDHLMVLSESGIGTMANDDLFIGPGTIIDITESSGAQWPRPTHANHSGGTQTLSYAKGNLVTLDTANFLGNLSSEISSVQQLADAVDDISLPVIRTTEVTTDHSLVSEDAGTCIEVDSSNPVNIEVPQHTTVGFPIGTVVEIYAAGSGTVTISGAGGVTVRNVGSISGQYATVRLRKRADNEWVLSGDVA